MRPRTYIEQSLHTIRLKTSDETTHNRFSPSAFFSKLFIAVIMGNGLIANFAPSIGVNAGTFAIDLMVVVLFAYASIKEMSGRSQGRFLIPHGYKPLFIIMLLIGALTALNSVVVGYYAPGLLSDLRIRFLYFLVVPAVYVILEPQEAQGVFAFFLNCGVLLCLFAIAQSLFSAYLDPKLLSVEYDGTLALSWSNETMSATLRSNALIGNAIEFGGVCVMLFAGCLADLLKNGFSPLRTIRAVVVLAGCYFSYSRIAFAGIVLISAALFLRLSKQKGVKKYLAFFILSFATITSLYLLLGDSALIDRFLGEDEFTSHSNDAHLSNTISALGVISDNALFGTGLGTQLVSDERATADGWWFQLAAETGIIVFVLYVVFFIFLAVKAFQSQKSMTGFCELMSVVVLVILGYFFVASFVNTSFFGRADITLLFILVACWLTSRREDERVE